MKKNEVEKLTGVKKLKKLRLSRETLQALTSADARMVAGGLESCQSGCPCCTITNCNTDCCPTS